MNQWTRILFVILVFTASAAYADCPAYSGHGSARDALRNLYMGNCLGYENDTAAITRTIVAKLPTVDANKVALRSSDDISALEQKVAELIDEVEASLAGAPRDPSFSSMYANVTAQMNDDRNSVLNHQHPAAKWLPDDMKILADKVDIGGALDAACNSSVAGASGSANCILAFKSSEQLIRHGVLMQRLLFESNSHIPELATEYHKLDKQWDYYFGKARSQYIWEFTLNAYLYHHHLMSDCTKTGKAEDACTRSLDTALHAPPNGQWIVMHPSAAIEYTPHDDSGGTANHSVAIVELLGYNKFGGAGKFPLDWPIGGSIISTVSLDSNGSRFGWGAMLHVRNNLSVAVARRKFAGKTETTWLLSVDLMKLFLEKKADAQDKFKFLK